jgi:uncharacterized membrane protein YkoI
MLPSKRKIYAGLTGIGITLGAAGLASAASSTSTSTVAVSAAGATAATTPTDPATAATSAQTGGGEAGKAPAYTSSVTVPVPTDGSKPTDAALHAVATVTADQATAAAVASTPGSATQTELKSVAGNVVWEVDVTATAGGSYDVVIDAGNATVLDTHAEGGHGGGGHGDHADKAPTYTSSVTVPVPTDGSKPTDAALQSVATVTADQAAAAAIANTPGTATQTELKSVAGNVVWEVDVTATAGGSYDVVIDAGNATVLDTHIEGGHGDGHLGGGHEATDATADTGTTATTTG